MKKMIITLGLAALMLFGVASVYAQGPGFGPGSGPEHRGMGMEQSWGPGHKGMHGQEHWGPAMHHKAFNLTPEQKTQFQELRRKFRQENAQLIGSLVTKRLELQSLWTDPKSDPKAILDKEKELRDFQNQMRDKMIQMKLEARKFLTPEQIANWRSGWETGHGHRMSYGRGRGSRGGCGMWQ
jgi:Spy/CpxP family protein refolding chaperone